MVYITSFCKTMASLKLMTTIPRYRKQKGTGRIVISNKWYPPQIVADHNPLFILLIHSTSRRLL